MSDTILQKLQKLTFSGLVEDVETFCGTGPTNDAQYVVLRWMAGQWQRQSAQMTSEQRSQLMTAALALLNHLRPLPTDQAAKLCETVYCFVYNCTVKNELQEVVSFSSHLRRLIPGGPSEALNSPWLGNLSTLLQNYSARARTAPLSAELRLLSLHFLLLSGAEDAKLSSSVFHIADWGRTSAGSAVAPALVDGLLSLAALASHGQREQMALAAVRLAGNGDRKPLLARLEPLWLEAPPAIRLVTALVEVTSGRPSALTSASGALRQLRVPAARDQLATEALHTVYTLLLPVTAPESNLNVKVTLDLTELACDCASLMSSCPLPAHMPPILVCRACNLAHSLLVAATRDTSATHRLAAAAVNMLRAMPKLGERLKGADSVWYSTVLVTVAGNLGIIARDAGCPSEAIDALHIFIDCLTAAGSVSLKSSNVAAKVQLLSDLLRSEARYSAALRALARALPFCAQHWHQLAITWAKVKRDAGRQTHADCMGRTIPSVLREVCGSGSLEAGDSSVTARLLKLEVKFYVMISANSGEDLCSEVDAALCELSSTPDLSDADRGWLLVARVRLPAGTDASTPQRVAEDCEKAVKLLTRKDADDTALDRCIANYQLCLGWKLVEMQAAKVAPLAQLTQRPAEPDDEVDLDASCTVVPDYLVLNLEREGDTLRPLRETLRLGELLLKQGVTESDGFCSNDLLSALRGTARIYAGLGYRIQAGRAWRLTLETALKLSSQNAVVTAACNLLELDLWPEGGDLDAVAAAVQARAPRDDLVTHRWAVARAWQHYHRHQIPEALELLDSVLVSPVLLSRTNANFVLAADAHRLASLCAGVPPATAGRNPVELAALAVFHALCVKAWLTTEKNEKGNSPAPLSFVVDEVATFGWVCDTVHHLGRILVTMHNPREVRNYVRDQIQSSHTIAAALRTAQMLSLLTEADLLCEDVDDTHVKLNTLHHILLHSSAASSHKPRPRPIPTVSKSSSPSTPLNNHLLPVPLGTPVARDARWQSRQPRCTSPSLRRLPLAAPPSLRHAAGCSCAGCGSPEAAVLNLLLGVQTARAAAISEDTDAAIQVCHLADELCDTLLEKVTSAASSLGQLSARQLSGQLQPLWAARCSCRLKLAEICSWSGRHQLAAAANGTALQLLRQLPEEHREVFVSRHMYLLTDIWNQRSLIDAALAAEQDRDQTAMGKHTDDRHQQIYLDPPAVYDESDGERGVSPGRVTPTPEIPAAEEPAAPPRRPNKRAPRVRSSLGSGEHPEPPTPPSAQLVRSSRRRAAAVKQELQQCEAEAAKAAEKPRTRSRARRGKR